MNNKGVRVKSLTRGVIAVKILRRWLVWLVKRVTRELIYVER